MHVTQLLAHKGDDVATISKDRSIADAVNVLRERGIGALVVTGSGAPLKGILSERDVVRAVADESVTALARPVSAYMTRAVATCSENDTVEDLMEMMTMGRFRHLPVVDNDVITGMISIGDVVKTRIAETVQEATSLRAYITAA